MNISAQDLCEIPSWFLLAGFDKCPFGFVPLPLPFIPYRFVEMWRSPERRMMVIVSGGLWADDPRRWVHVSFSRKDRIPSYADMVTVKRLFIGDERQALQVLPEKKNWANEHPNCLHLWHCVDGDGLPNFAIDGRV